jgi:hypothetical protein
MPGSYLCVCDMSEPAPNTPPHPDRVSTDDAIAAQMARYEAARCRSVKELVAAYGGTRGVLTAMGDSEATAILSGTGGNDGPGAGAWLRLRSQVRLIAGKCRRIWEIVSL